MNWISTIVRPCVAVFAFLALITGVVYPLAMTAFGQLVFPISANGSLITASGKPTTQGAKAVGSRLIGQEFAAPGYFWPRPSATTPAYNADGSGGSNFGPRSPALLAEVKAAIARLQAAAPDNHQPIPVDLVTSSGSGLDPDISPAAAYYQAGRVAAARQIPVKIVDELIERCIRSPWLDFYGERYVNVLDLNIRLNAICSKLHAGGRSTKAD